MASQVKVEGFREFERVLTQDLPKATGKRIVTKVLKDAAQPIADIGQANAPLGPTGKLKKSYGVGTKLTRRQAALNRKSESKSMVEVHIGPNDPAGVQTEFGNEHQAAEPHLRPAWEAGKRRALADIVKGLAASLAKAVARARKKASKS